MLVKCTMVSIGYNHSNTILYWKYVIPYTRKCWRTKPCIEASRSVVKFCRLVIMEFGVFCPKISPKNQPHIPSTTVCQLAKPKDVFRLTLPTSCNESVIISYIQLNFLVWENWGWFWDTLFRGPCLLLRHPD